MAEQPPIPTETDQLLNDVAAAVVDRLVSSESLGRIARASEAAGLEFIKTVLFILFRLTMPIATAGIEAITEASEGTREARAHVLAASMRNIFGVQVDAAHFGHLNSPNVTEAVSASMVRTMLDALTGGSKSIEPSEEPAQRYVQLVLNQALEGWAMGATMELLSAIIPAVEQVQTLGEASTKVATALGISDSSSRVLRPYIDNLVVEPLRRKIDSTYRPALLAVGDVARAYWSGRLPREDAFTELAVQGWSDEKAEILLEGARRRLGVSDVRTLFDRGEWGVTEALEHLRAQGYDAETAGLALQMELLRRQERHESDLASAAIGAYVAGDLSRAQLVGFLGDAVTNASERGLYLELADARRTLKQKRLSPGEARQCVRAGILSVRDYREALRRDGYDPEAVLALELLLAQELAEDRELEEKRAAAETAKAARLAARDAEEAARRERLEAERAAARRGDEADLERAAIRGLIPLARVEELYRQRFDEDTAAIYMQLLEDERERYLEEQRRREDAIQRGRRRELDVGDLEQAVLVDVLTLDRYRSALEARGFDAADIDVLTRTLAARKAALDAARAQRRDAERRAARQGLDLGRFEQLVRRGRRTLAQYADFLAGLGYDEPARAAMRELLELQIADDTKAREARAGADAELRARGLSLEEFRRAVVLELQTRDDFERFLLAQRFTADRIALLMAELDQAVTDAQAARRRREAADVRVDGRTLPLAVVRRAARLGRITPATYQARLAREGFDEADIALETDLLLSEIADVQAARRAREAPPAADAPKGLTLAELARAVRRELQPLAAFEARAYELGFAAPDVRTQLRILGDELLEARAAAVRKAQLAAGLEGGPVTLAGLEALVKSGAATVAAFVQALAGVGLALEDAELLGAVLREELEA